MKRVRGALLLIMLLFFFDCSREASRDKNLAGFGNIFDQNVTTVMLGSEKAVAFKYPYWLIHEGTTYPLSPYDRLFISVGNVKTLTWRVDLQRLQKPVEEGHKTYYYFNDKRQLKGIASYSDGEYHFDKYVYDEESRLAEMISSMETNLNPYRTVQFRYVDENAPVCYITDQQGIAKVETRVRKVVERSEAGGAIRYEWQSSEPGFMDSTILIVKNERIQTVSQVSYGDGGRLEARKDLARENGIITGLNYYFIEKDGTKKEISIKRFYYDVEGRLDWIDVTDSRNSANNYQERITQRDKKGNWLRMEREYGPGEKNVITREIHYFE